MAEITKSPDGVSLCSLEPKAGSRIVGQAGEDIAAGDACRMNSSGVIVRSSGAAANANANVLGFALRAVVSGGDITLIAPMGDRLNYGSTLTPGAALFLSGTVAGGLADAASTGGTEPVAIALDAKRIQLIGHGKVR